MFNSPVGMAFSSDGYLWFQADRDEGQDNNQMLVGNTETGEIARFLTAPKGAEVTGLTWSPNKKVDFVVIQHPGGEGKPRSSVIAVWRKDGVLIG